MIVHPFVARQFTPNEPESVRFDSIWKKGFWGSKMGQVVVTSEKLYFVQAVRKSQLARVVEKSAGMQKSPIRDWSLRSISDVRVEEKKIRSYLHFAADDEMLKFYLPEGAATHIQSLLGPHLQTEAQTQDSLHS